MRPVPLSKTGELVLPSLALAVVAVGLIAGLVMIPLQDEQPAPNSYLEPVTPVTFAERFP
jgi:hypothetical protein